MRLCYVRSHLLGARGITSGGEKLQSRNFCASVSTLRLVGCLDDLDGGTPRREVVSGKRLEFSNGVRDGQDVCVEITLRRSWMENGRIAIRMLQIDLGETGKT